MTLTEWILEVALGSRAKPSTLSFALAGSGREIKGSGYRRASVPEWRVNLGRAKTIVRFGPFTSATAFDALLFLADEEVIETVPLGKIAMSPGMMFEYAPSLTFEQVPA